MRNAALQGATWYHAYLETPRLHGATLEGAQSISEAVLDAVDIGAYEPEILQGDAARRRLIDRAGASQTARPL